MGGRMDTEIRAQKVDQGKEKSPARTRTLAFQSQAWRFTTELSPLPNNAK